MKNKLYFAGLISSMIIVAGGLMKIMHFPGASILLMTGILVLCLIFLPPALISCYRDGEKRKGFLYVAIFITIGVDFIGALFKILHWPGASILLMLGLLFPIVLFLPSYLYYHFKDQEDSQSNFLFVMFLLVYLSVMSVLLALNPTKNIVDDSRRIETLSNLDAYYQLKE